jgi:hypothetical protein
MILSNLRNASMLVVLAIYSAHLIAQSPDPPASKDTLYQTISQLDADLFGAMGKSRADGTGPKGNNYSYKHMIGFVPMAMARCCGLLLQEHAYRGFLSGVRPQAHEACGERLPIGGKRPGGRA